MSDKSPSPGFTLLQSSDIPEYRARGIWLTHNATGCQVYHLLAEDEENFFSFCFKTPSFNNRGAAHIVEHAVLSGSENYPVKDPFIQLLKGSMHTFLNAMTYPDKTIYPAASTLAKDLFNVMAVYGDAVFFPLLRREVFWQEGHRIQLGPENRAGITGVVYNEMKGNYANHDSIAAEWSYRSLFPDTPYAFDAGGDPEVIPDLTYEEFLTFHRTYYHPSNCRIFLYGNIPTETYLTFLEERFLGVFGKIPLSSDIPDQPAWKAPAVLEKTCHLGAEESPRGKTTITLNWLLGHAFEPSKALEMEIIAEILIGNPGAVLYKALVESGLGQDLSPVSGLDMHTRQMVFTIGLRGTDPEKQQDFENLVMETLRNLTDKGIPQEMLEGVLRRVEFQNREIKGGIPFGLRLCGRVLQGWMHNESPEKTLLFETYMEELKKKVSAAGRYLEGLIDSWLTANVHRTTVLVRPDPLHGQN
ncbi:MAG: peptidase M16, partial [Spirochaetales bacterium]